MNEFDPLTISKLMRQRRSVFPAQYSGEVVSKHIIEEMLENANWAPTHKFTEPWKFTVFSGDGLKKLGDFMATVYRQVASANGTFDEKKFEKLKHKPTMASHVISIGMKRDEKERVPQIEEIEAVACAVQNMYLTATAHGIGCYWGSGGITYFEEAKAFFDLGDKDKLLGFLYVGVPGVILPPGKRRPVSEKTRWIY